MKFPKHLHSFKKPPTWKGILIILLAIAIPLLYSYIRDAQLQNALQSTTPADTQLPSEVVNSSKEAI
jgi:hypothetical protein